MTRLDAMRGLLAAHKPDGLIRCLVWRFKQADRNRTNIPEDCHLTADVETLKQAAQGVLELGRKDTSNQKYDPYYDTLRAALRQEHGE